MVSVLSLPSEITFASPTPADCNFLGGYTAANADCIVNSTDNTLKQTYISSTQMILNTNAYFMTPLCAITTSNYYIKGYTSDMVSLAWQDNIGTVTVTAGVISVGTKTRSVFSVGAPSNYTLTFTT